MERYIERIKAAFARSRVWLIFSLAATYLWGLLAHGYCFFDNSISHDSLAEYHGTIYGSLFKMELGRVFTPVYRDIFRSDATLPWLIGMLALLWLGLTVFLVLRIFRVESKVTAALIAGIFTVNISVSAFAATYLHDLDSNMFSLMLAMAAVYLWKYCRHGWLPGAALIAVSLGIYQAYMFSAAAVVMMVCMLWLLDGERFSTVMIRGLKAIGMFLLGGVLYYLGMRGMLRLAGVAMSSGNYNSVDSFLQLTPATFVSLSVDAYREYFGWLLYNYTTYPGFVMKRLPLLLAALAAVSVFQGFRHMRLGEIGLFGVLLLLMPYVMNMLHLLTLGNDHELMTYAVWLTYLLPLLLTSRLLRRWRTQGWKAWTAGAIHGVAMLAVFLIVYGGVQYANGMYLKKDQEFDAYLSLMTRIVGRMEMQEDYIPGETPVVFVGLPQDLNPSTPGFEEYGAAMGMQSTDVLWLPERSRFQAYFDYILEAPILLAEMSTWNETIQSPLTDLMPCYPAAGCMEMRDGVLVVRLGSIPRSPE